MVDIDKPSSKEVTEYHTNSDKDGSKVSQHHTLGAGVNQAAPGNHRHRGGDSPLILDGETLTGAKGGNVALTNLIAILVSEFGLTDNTT